MLLDTSIWVDHFRRGDAAVGRALLADRVWSHEFVLGELSLGHFRHRKTTLALLARLPQAPTARHEEVVAMVDRHHLWGRGLSWIDAHLLASAGLAGIPLWTRDKALLDAARGAGLPVIT